MHNKFAIQTLESTLEHTDERAFDGSSNGTEDRGWASSFARIEYHRMYDLGCMWVDKFSCADEIVRQYPSVRFVCLGPSDRISIMRGRSTSAPPSFSINSIATYNKTLIKSARRLKVLPYIDPCEAKSESEWPR